MRSTYRALAAAAVAAAMIAAAGTADAAPTRASAPEVTVKKVCRDDGKTRVRVDIKTFAKDMLIEYDWSVGGGDSHPADALLEGKYDARLFAFTIGAGKTGQIAIGDKAPNDVYSGPVKAKKCS